MVVVFGLVLRDAQHVGFVWREGAHAVDTSIDAPEQVALPFRERCSHSASLAVLCSCQTIALKSSVVLNALRESESRMPHRIGRRDNRQRDGTPRPLDSGPTGTSATKQPSLLLSASPILLCVPRCCVFLCLNYGSAANRQHKLHTSLLACSLHMIRPSIQTSVLSISLIWCCTLNSVQPRATTLRKLVCCMLHSLCQFPFLDVKKIK